MMATSSRSLSAALQLVGNHLWQSTLCLAGVALLTLLLRHNRAHVRYWLWLAASVKFLIPFAPLMALGRQFAWRSTATVQPEMSFLLDTMSQPFSQPALHIAGATSSGSAIHGLGHAVTALLVGIWFLGCAAVLLTWWAGWRRVAAAVRHGRSLEDGREVATLRRLEQIRGLNGPIAVIASDTSFGPGVFGIARPVLLWPQGIGDCLDDRQLEAILAHEVCHVRRRDNLAVVVHMLVEAVFWFHPLVWWIERCLVDERERACDEEVIRWGSQPDVYAESILKTCEFYVESPLLCVAGVTGADLNRRIERIMTNRVADALSSWRKFLLAGTGAASIAAPIVLGALNAQQLHAQSPATNTALAFDVASVRQNRSGDGGVFMRNQPGGRSTANNVTVSMLIQSAYRLQSFQLLGGPNWLTSDRFDVVAKASSDLGAFFGAQSQDPTSFQLMMRALLADRFKLAVHHETRELPVYALVLARSDKKLGPQLRAAPVDCAALAAARGRGDAPPPDPPAPDARPTCGMKFFFGNLAAGSIPLSLFASSLSLAMLVNRTVLDRTGLNGLFDVDLTWTPDQMSQGPPRDSDLPSVDPNGPSIFTAVQEQLGLKLQPTTGPVDVLVIDHVEHPTEN